MESRVRLIVNIQFTSLHGSLSWSAHNFTSDQDLGTTCLAGPGEIFSVPLGSLEGRENCGTKEDHQESFCQISTFIERELLIIETFPEWLPAPSVKWRQKTL